MSIVGNAISAGGIRTQDNALLRVSTNLSNVVTITVTKDTLNLLPSFQYLDTVTDTYTYYFVIPSSEFSQSLLDVFTINGSGSGKTGTATILITESIEYDVALKFLSEKYQLFGNGVNLFGDFSSLVGSEKSQSDTLTYTTNYITYTENNNDYGGIVTNSNLMNIYTTLLNYNSIHFSFSNLNSWQDPPYYASVEFYNSKVSRLTDGYANTSTSQVFRYPIYQNSGNNIINVRTISDFSIPINVTMISQLITCYMYILVASGEKSGVGKGSFTLTEIWLEP